MQNAFSLYIGIFKAQWLELLAGLTNSLCSGALYFVALYLVNELHFGVALTGAIIGWFGVGSVFGGYLAGWLCDRTSAHKVSIWAMLSNGFLLFLLLVPALHHAWTLGLVLMLTGLSNNGFATANRVSILSATEGRDQLRAINLRRLMINFGAGIAFVVGGWLAGYGYDLFFAVISLLLILPGFGMWLWMPEMYRNRQQKNPTSILAREQPQAVMLMLVLTFVVSLVLAQLRATYGLYLQQFGGFSLQGIGYLFALNSILILILQIPLIDYLSRFHAAISTGVGGVLVCWGMGVLAFWPHQWGAICSCILWTFGEIIFYTTVQVYIYNHAPHAKRARYSGAYQTIYGFANLVGPAAGGWIYEFDAALLWYICMALGLMAFFLSVHIYQKALLDS